MWLQRQRTSRNSYLRAWRFVSAVEPLTLRTPLWLVVGPITNTMSEHQDAVAGSNIRGTHPLQSCNNFFPFLAFVSALDQPLLQLRLVFLQLIYYCAGCLGLYVNPKK